jgi:hypothetical protein
VPYLPVCGGALGDEILGVMLFPLREDEPKRRAYIARRWCGFYPRYVEAKAGPLVPSSVHLSVMEAVAAAPLDKAEIEAREQQGIIAGELLKMIYMIARTNPKLATWRRAIKLISWHIEEVNAPKTPKSRASLLVARDRFFSVAHLWAAWCLRDRKFYCDPEAGYSFADDFQVFLAEAMALAQWATTFTPDRAKATTIIRPDKVDLWRVPPEWSPPSHREGWPRDGRVWVPLLPDIWMHRTNAASPAQRRRVRKPV